MIVTIQSKKRPQVTWKQHRRANISTYFSINERLTFRCQWGGVRHFRETWGKRKKREISVRIECHTQTTTQKMVQSREHTSPTMYLLMSTSSISYSCTVLNCMISAIILTLLTIFNHVMIYYCSLGAMFCALPKRQVPEKLSGHLELPLLKLVCSYVLSAMSIIYVHFKQTYCSSTPPCSGQSCLIFCEPWSKQVSRRHSGKWLKLVVIGLWLSNAVCTATSLIAAFECLESTWHTRPDIFSLILEKKDALFCFIFFI